MAYSTKEIELYNGKKLRVRSQSYPIDPVKFKAALMEKNITMKEAALKMGYSSNSVSSAVNAGYFNGIMITGFSTYYGLEYENYAYIPAPKQPEPVSKEPEPVKPEQNKAQEQAAIYNIAYAAVYDAIGKVFDDKLQDIRNAIYTSMLCALRKNREERMNERK